MIHSNKQIGVIYGGEGIRYARELKEIIAALYGQGYPIDCVLIDGQFRKGTGTIDDRIFKDLASCDYFVVFLTKDLEYEPGKYVSKPNVMLELGIALSHVGRDDVLCLAPFPGKELKDSYLFPSDIPSQMIGEISPDNSREDIREDLCIFLAGRGVIPAYRSTSAKKSETLLVTPDYKTDYAELFTPFELATLEKYSMKAQLNEIFRNWVKEKELLQDVEKQILFVYERVVFLSFFTNGSLEDNLSDLFRFDLKETSETNRAAVRLLPYILDYIRIRKDPRFNPIRLRKCLDMIQNINSIIASEPYPSFNPLIRLIAVDYLGLAYLHAAMEYRKKAQEDKAQEMAALSIALLLQALEISQGLEDSIGIFPAYLYYNLGRAYTECNNPEEAIYYFVESYHSRSATAQSKALPAYFSASFFVESYLSEIEKCKCQLRFGEIDGKQAQLQYEKYRQAVDDYQNNTTVFGIAIFGEFYREIHQKLGIEE